jgi:hypothetical protein
MEKHRRLLELAAGGQLPERIDEQSTPDFEIYRELIEAGHLQATNVSSHEGRAYLEPRITLTGRECLSRVPMTRSYTRIAVLILGVLIGLLGNVATSSLPDKWKPYLWLSWAPLGVCILILLVLHKKNV